MAGTEWRAPAVADLTAIVEYIAEDNPAAAFELAEEIDARISSLAEQPRLGRPGRVEGTRELVVHPSYIVV